MPFTFAHPAAVLPIHARLRKWLSLPALAIGSMVPDAAYFLPLPVGYKLQAHTFLGALTYAVPVGIAVLLIFYWVAPEFAGLLPSPQREALEPAAHFPPLSLGDAWLGLAGLIIGVETHILWDSFTHDGGWFVLRLPFLQTAVWGARLRTFGSIHFRTHGFFVYDALEYLCSLVGLAIVLYFCDRWLRIHGIRLWTAPQPSARLYLWITVLVGSVVEAVVVSHAVQMFASGAYLRTRRFLVILLTAFLHDLVLALVALPAIVKLRRLVRDARLRDSAY